MGLLASPSVSAAPRPPHQVCASSPTHSCQLPPPFHVCGQLRPNRAPIKLSLSPKSGLPPLSPLQRGITTLPMLPGQKPQSLINNQLLPFACPCAPTPHSLSILATSWCLWLPKLQTQFCCQAFVQGVPSTKNTPPSPLLPEDSFAISSSGSPPISLLR